MYWLIAILVVLLFMPFLGYLALFIAGLIVFNFLIVFLTAFFGINFRRRPGSQPQPKNSPAAKDIYKNEDVEDADFKEER